SADPERPRIGALRVRRAGVCGLLSSCSAYHARTGATLELMSSYPPIRPPARLLLGPGPSMVAPRVYQALAQPLVGHLDPYFFEVAEEVRKLLGYVFSTNNAFNLAISGTGSSGMEAA